MHEILAVMLVYAAVAFVLAKRLHGVDPDLTTFAYFRRIMAAQARLGTLLLATDRAADLSRKPDGRPMPAAFTRHVAITAACGLLSLLLALGSSIARHGL